MSKEKINIGFFITVYSFFLYLLINGYNEKDIFIFTDLFPKEVSRNVKHIEVAHIGFIDGGPKMAPLNSIRGILENIIGYWKYFYGYLKLRILLFIKTYNKNVEVYGHAHVPLTFMFYENENSNIIEDGLLNYTADICETHEINPLIDKILHLFGIYFLNMNEGFGSHKNIKNVYLTREFNHPLIKDKITAIDMQKMWDSLPDNEQKKILNIFNINIDKLNFNGKTALILTEPLFKEKLATFEEEQEIYNHFINKFKNYNIIIKPHPRDEKNYNEIYPNVTVIDRFFPIELLTLININPTIVCSVVSTALLNFKDSKIYVYPKKLSNKRLNEVREKLLKMINESNKNNLIN